MSKSKKKRIILTEEEKEIETSIASGEWSSSTGQRKLYENAAKATLGDQKKEARVNIRMTEHELSLVKSAAEREGMPYQTLMSSILHKYLTGQLVDRKIIDEIRSVFKKTG
jgi:predicted DNA binding CopG/RHH family protein